MPPEPLIPFVMGTYVTLGIVLPLLVAGCLFRLWRRSRDAALIWLMAGIGMIPALRYVSYAGRVVLEEVIDIGGFHPASPLFYIALFLQLMLECMAIGCIVVALGQLGGCCTTFRDLFSFTGGQASGEDS